MSYLNVQDTVPYLAPRTFQKSGDLEIINRWAFILPFILLFFAFSLLFLANGNFYFVPAVLVFLLVGFLFVCVFFNNSKVSYESYTFLFVFAISIFWAGVYLCFYGVEKYADINHFYLLSRVGLNEQTINELGSNGALPIMVWRFFYSMADALGFGKSMWVGVLVNSFLLGISGGLTVKTARLIFGPDAHRLVIVSLLFACCPLFWFFGGTHIRDVFALLLNTILIYYWVRFLTVPGVLNFIFLVVVTVAFSPLMYYVRFESAMLPILISLFGFTAFTFGTRSKKGLLVVFCLIFFGFFAGYDHIITFWNKAQILANNLLHSYWDGGPAGTSLGTLVVVSQPLPIRLVTGSVYMHLFPIPLWTGLFSSESLYLFLRSLQGFFIMLIMPLGLAGMWQVTRSLFLKKERVSALVFILFFYIFLTLAVVATSLEPRHHVQFMPAIFILAAVPDLGQHKTRAMLRKVGLSWYSVVVLIHLSWICLKFC